MSQERKLQFRPGKRAIEFRFDAGSWILFEAKKERQVLIDAYHPDGSKWEKGYNKAK